ncbi:CU044_2847 family protein [Actinokineospora sp. G85]|uniref:CU044_2847 family protein n=1 Tax=Actinokineospora sp. G85 TaxID=3406626 RepID=UPI003C786558
MTDLVQFPLSNGASVLVEVDAAHRIAPAGRAADVLDRARVSLEDALSGVVGAAEAALHRFRDMDKAPDEVELKFGVKLDVEAGAFIAKTGVQGQLEVKLRWRRDDSVVPEEVEESAE